MQAVIAPAAVASAGSSSSQRQQHQQQPQQWCSLFNRKAELQYLEDHFSAVPDSISVIARAAVKLQDDRPPVLGLDEANELMDWGDKFKEARGFLDERLHQAGEPGVADAEWEAVHEPLSQVTKDVWRSMKPGYRPAPDAGYTAADYATAVDAILKSPYKAVNDEANLLALRPYSPWAADIDAAAFGPKRRFTMVTAPPPLHLFLMKEERSTLLAPLNRDTQQPLATGQSAGQRLLLLAPWGASSSASSRTATTVAQVRAAGLNAVAQMSGGDVPCDLLTGRAFWAGQTAIVFTMPSSAVRQLTAYMVVMLKQQLQRVLHWRAVFTFNGAVILSARGAYAGRTHAGRREQLSAGLVLSNQYAVLEPDAELSQAALPGDDYAAEGYTEEEEDELVPASEDEEQQPAGTEQAAPARRSTGQNGAPKRFIAVVYMPDMTKHAPVRRAAYSALQEDLAYLSSRGSVLIMGDFNARVKLRLNAQPNDFKVRNGEQSAELEAYQEALAQLGAAYTSTITVLQQQVSACLQRLRTGKAGNPAEEGIVNELLKYGGNTVADMLLLYCSLMWQLEQVHQVPGTVVSMPKKGDLTDPGNYRGITLLSVLYKFYTSVLNQRLIKFAEGKQQEQQQQTQAQQQQQQQQGQHSAQQQQQQQQPRATAATAAAAPLLHERRAACGVS
ncbi:hypothetical protein COO60DRAFT_1635487 [Scenedesmus sp. NREL 46B-D3]|nr:hypothetical protein COO60DRAFT_1635487 [Scenedesmus sp. NREL 46B-D3]